MPIFCAPLADQTFVIDHLAGERRLGRTSRAGGLLARIIAGSGELPGFDPALL